MLIRWLKKILKIHSPSKHGMTSEECNELMKAFYEGFIEGLGTEVSVSVDSPPTQNQN